MLCRQEKGSDGLMPKQGARSLIVGRSFIGLTLCSETKHSRPHNSIVVAKRAIRERQIDTSELTTTKHLPIVKALSLPYRTDPCKLQHFALSNAVHGRLLPGVKYPPP